MAATSTVVLAYWGNETGLWAKDAVGKWTAQVPFGQVIFPKRHFPPGRQRTSCQGRILITWEQGFSTVFRRADYR